MSRIRKSQDTTQNRYLDAILHPLPAKKQRKGVFVASCLHVCLLHGEQHALTPPCSAHACHSARPRPRRHLPRDHGCCWYGLCSLQIQKLNQIARFLAVPQQVWMDERERMMLEWNLRPNMTMLEYGSGASTLHFSRYSHVQC